MGDFMKIRRFFRRSKATLSVLMFLIGALSLTAAGVPERTGVVTAGSLIAKISLPHQISGFWSVGALPAVSTDKNDYAPGETVQISGSGFAANEPVTLLVVHISSAGLKAATTESIADHEGHTPWTVNVS